MQIQSLRAYFTYSIPLSNWLDLAREDDLGLCVEPEIIACLKAHFDVAPVPVPAGKHVLNYHLTERG